jgi:hypothetical protein
MSLNRCSTTTSRVVRPAFQNRERTLPPSWECAHFSARHPSRWRARGARDEAGPSLRRALSDRPRRRLCHRPLKLAVLPEKACGLRGLLCFPVRRKRGLRGGAAPSANDSTSPSRRDSCHPSRWRRRFATTKIITKRSADWWRIPRFPSTIRPQHGRSPSRIRVLEIVTTCFTWLLTGSRTPLDLLRSGTPRTPGARPRSHSRWDSWNS